MAAGKPEARIVDANLNRAAEALRVTEDICRFNWDLPGLSRELKELRHAILNAFAPVPETRVKLTGKRDIEEDVGRDIPAVSLSGVDLPGTAIRNLQRAKEALRTLEEVGQVCDKRAAALMAGLRYRLYSIEKGILALAFRAEPNPMADVKLYLIATEEVARIPLVEAVRAALDGGAGAVQLREKKISDRRILSLGRAIREVTARRGVPFIVNDRPDLALLLEADGVHLGQDDLPISSARSVLGERRLIGISTHSVQEARQAARQGASYIGMGAAFETPTKKVQHLLGPEELKSIQEAVDLPAFAIGGIRRENLSAIVAAGCNRICISSGILSLASPREIEGATRSITAALQPTGR